MREAWHTNDAKIYIIPLNLSKTEFENHKQIAKKGTFLCPYCKAKLYVKGGEKREKHFSHLHGESCEESKKSEARYTKYVNQKKNDTPRHPQILAIMKDEFDVLSKVYPFLNNSYGYLNPLFTKYIPDISLIINDHKYAITVLTNISSTNDITTARNIQKQKDYYESIGYEPLFFIERSHLGIDIDGQSLVLWATEREALTSQKADLQWQGFLSQLAPIVEQQKVLKLPKTDLIVKSIMYITPANQAIAVEVFHVLEQSNTTPVKAYFLSYPYTITFSQAFKLDADSLTLADLNVEMDMQSKYAEKLKAAKEAFIAEQQELERLKLEEGKLAKPSFMDRKQQTLIKQKTYQDSFNNSDYSKADANKKMEMLKRMYNLNN
ncbi:competence protein CoiA family protein [Solibacillus sp. CAU 1738]|uniref:competence protein CoiA family protein n=1 Tax=Solibacillus sp. CAU 1738 TaxID=3140363 RepID=UPI0032617265